MPAKASSAVDPSSANAPTTSKRARKGTKTEKSRKEAVAKSEKSPTKKVDAEVQRFCEEGNERGVAKRVRGKALRDNEPIDIEVRDKTGALKHGVEVKTLVFRKASRIKVDPAAQDRKRKWHQKNKGVPFHTIVYDDRLVFNAKGPGKHDYSKRIVYYRRGYGSFALSKMHRITGGNKELRALMEKPYHQLPKGAKTPAKRSKRPPARAIAPRRKR